MLGLAALLAGILVGGSLVAVLTHKSMRKAQSQEGGPVIAANVPGEKVLATLRAGVVLLGARDELEYANHAAKTLGVIGDGHLDSSVLRGLVSHVRRSGKSRDAELELPRRGGGEPTHVRVRVTKLPDDSIVIEAEDITELHRVERVRRDFVANVSHELKTPVGAMQLLAEALSDAVDDPEAAARFTARIQHESGRMARLVSELLELSRVQGAEAAPEPVDVDVDRVVLEALDRARTGAAAKNIFIKVIGERGLVSWGSEAQLAMAVGNLIDNAINYSPADTTVTVETAAKGRELSITVTDQGIGIAEADLDRIFERFYRADPARSRATGGTGLGLAIVKHIAGNHGGKVNVTSTPGTGSTFTLLLPSRAVRSADRAQTQGEM
ncbi:two-component sensor histidine kinase [Actinorhabdospora filicis]|uniref:Sensor-like histidine kinase SenX3 n=2 Tax=Actinorhabdospora filicis TaxID=1785913 RepID=A0A9W6W996_9ACTN|nr:two-component sensor histidine kinase [Actinorhabdospora filicis]